jgi:hypothetical protein
MGMMLAMLGIHDILVRFRIPGSVPLTNFFSHNLPTGTSSSVYKNKFFAKILFQSAQQIFEKRARIRIRSRIRTSDQWIRIRIREAQKHGDPDPKHWKLGTGIKGVCGSGSKSTSKV